MNLYWNVWPAGKFNVMDHTGLLEVYCEADRAGALPVSHAPSWLVEPAILIVSPTTVVIFSVNVTETAVGQAVPVVVTAVVRVAVESVVAVPDAVPETRTTGPPLETVTQMLPLPSEVYESLLNAFFHAPFDFCALKQCCWLFPLPAFVVRTMRLPFERLKA